MVYPKTETPGVAGKKIHLKGFSRTFAASASALLVSGFLFSRVVCAAEMLIFDLNAPRQITDCFAYEKPPRENGDWTKPINYAQGTVHIRSQVISIPKEQPGMRLQLCIWQWDAQNVLHETCMKQYPVPGIPGTVRTFAQPLAEWWKNKKGGAPDWTKPRTRHGAVVRCATGANMWSGMQWCRGTEDPKDWYPLKVRMTAVIVSPGATFSGWSNYLGVNKPAPHVELQTRLENRVFSVGDTISVVWSADATQIQKVVFQFSPDDGKTWETISPAIPVRSGSGSGGTYKWAIPADLNGVNVATESGKIKVMNPDGAKEMAISEGSFKIKTTGIRLLPANGSTQSGGLRLVRGPQGVSVNLPQNGNWRMQVTDVAGRRISFRRGDRGTRILISSKNLRTGIYFLKIHTAGGSYAVRFLAS